MFFTDIPVIHAGLQVRQRRPPDDVLWLRQFKARQFCRPGDKGFAGELHAGADASAKEHAALSDHAERRCRAEVDENRRRAVLLIRRHCVRDSVAAQFARVLVADVDTRFDARNHEQRRLPDESPAQVLEAARGVTAAAVLSDELGCQAVPCLEAVLTAYRQMRLMQNLRSQACAVPKATVGLLSVLPAVTVALGELLGARPLAFLLGSPRGVVCLVLGGCCYAAGLAWMRALLKGSGL